MRKVYLVSGYSLVLVLSLLLLCGCTASHSSRPLEPTFISYPVSNSGCLDALGVEICNKLSTPKQSLFWRYFDPSNEALVAEARKRETNFIGLQYIVRNHNDHELLRKRWNEILIEVFERPVLGELFINPAIGILNQPWARKLLKDTKPIFILSLTTRKWQFNDANFIDYKDKILDAERKGEFGQSAVCQLYGINKPCQEVFDAIEREKIIQKIIEMLNRSDKTSLISLNVMYWYWDYARFIDHVEKTFRSKPREIMWTDSPGAPRLQIDRMGTLYASELFLNSLSERQKTTALYHEAGHIKYLTLEYLFGALLEIFDIMENTHNDIGIERFIKIARTPDESLIDLLAIEAMQATPLLLEDYESLLTTLEWHQGQSARIKLISLTKDYIRAGYHVNNLVKLRIRNSLDRCRQPPMPTAPFYVQDEKENVLLQRYVTILSEYLTDRTLDMIAPYAKWNRDEVMLARKQIQYDFKTKGAVYYHYKDGDRTYNLCFAGAVL